MRVYVAHYEHRHGDDLAVFATHELAEAWKRDVAQEWWEEAFDTEPPKPFTDEDAAEYFDAREDEWFTISACEVEGL